SGVTCRGSGIGREQDGVDQHLGRVGVARTGVAVPGEGLMDLLAQRPGLGRRDEYAVVAIAEDVAPLAGPGPLGSEPPVGPLLELGGVVAGQPGEGRLGVLVALELTGRPLVAAA